MEPVRLGIVTDIQYADKPDVYLDHISKVRAYSRALAKTDRAVAHFNAARLSAVIHLGDIVDGNADVPKTHQDLDSVIARLSRLNTPVCHVLGNHCLTVHRSYLLKQLNLDSGRAYYYRNLSPRWRLIVLDTVDVSILRAKHSPHHRQAIEYLEKHWHEPNAKLWNGGLGQEQLTWLQAVLRDTAEAGMYAVVCGHLPVLAEASKPTDIVWGDAVIVDLFREYRSVIKAYFCGHCHRGGYGVKDGVHHVTFEALLDADDEEGSCGVVELRESSIVVHGHGDMTSRVLDL